MNLLAPVTGWTFVNAVATVAALNVKAFAITGTGGPSGTAYGLSPTVPVATGQQVTVAIWYDARNVAAGGDPQVSLRSQTNAILATAHLVPGAFGVATLTYAVVAGVTTVAVRAGANNSTIATGTNLHIGNPQLVVAPDVVDTTLERPGVSDAAMRVYSGLGAWSRADGPSTGWSLLYACEALAGAGMVDDLAAIVMDSVAGPGWSSVVDVDRCPDAWLAWLGMFVGVPGQPGGVADRRAQIRSKPAWQKGKPAAIIAAAKLWLSGTQVVELHERDAGDAYKVSVVVQTAQVLNQTQLVGAVEANIPAGMVHSRIEVETGSSYAAVERDYPGTYTALEAAFANYTALTAYRTPTDLTTIGT